MIKQKNADILIFAAVGQAVIIKYFKGDEMLECHEKTVFSLLFEK